MLGLFLGRSFLTSEGLNMIPIIGKTMKNRYVDGALVNRDEAVLVVEQRAD